ncbi:hypothetical protein GGD65_007724 [Bradyrhizobium sp. CIR18]|uniref:hypothetical protein n=1 Tax=Bradyrhizobium sp. CIR18 TaxID=2663839 RepID=UPI001606C6E3|nr:hypothetical protein [Bradyrhizobium sp. CIR18]MBB4366651.1 hypothetical protein [Bradyrhizobium sp. CIR18]
MMERAQIEENIAMTERHISLGEAHIARQIEIIAKFKRKGHESSKPSGSWLTSRLLNLSISNIETGC